MNDRIDNLCLDHDENGFNLTMEEVRILAKYRELSPHQQKGIVQAIDLIRPAVIVKRRRGESLR